MRRILPILLLGASTGHAMDDEAKTSTPPSSSSSETSLRRIHESEITDSDLYANCSQYIQHAIEEAQAKVRTEERTKSLKEGRQEGMRATALKMLQKKMSDADILEFTELTQAQLDQLKKDTAEKQQK